MNIKKIIYLLDNTPNQPSTFRTKNWVEINDHSLGNYSTGSQIRFKFSVPRLSLCDYSGAYIRVSGTTTITGEGFDNVAKRTDERDEGVIFKNCALSAECTSEIINNQIDHAKDLDVLMTMYKLMQYRDNYSKASERQMLF